MTQRKVGPPWYGCPSRYHFHEVQTIAKTLKEKTRITARGLNLEGMNREKMGKTAAGHKLGKSQVVSTERVRPVLREQAKNGQIGSSMKGDLTVALLLY
jgi:hypothetical protein